MEEQQFYSVFKYADRLDAGDQIYLKHSLSFNPANADLTPLVGKTEDQLKAMIEDSKAAEQEIYGRLVHALSEWEEQGAQTLLMNKALEYVKTKQVEHTSNQWVDKAHHEREISNMVYKMTYQIWEDNRYDHRLKKSVPMAWYVSWRVNYNTPRQPGNQYHYNSDVEVASQDKKKYTDKAAAEKYVQGRISAYAHLFTELSPPIPENMQRLFKVNGKLLPGYTVAPHEPTPEELLDFLEDTDIDVPAPAVSKPKDKAATPKKQVSKSVSAKKKPAHVR